MISYPKIAILYSDSGEGHWATALALKAILEQEITAEVNLVNPYKDLFPNVDLFLRFTGMHGEEVYNEFVLRKGWNNLFCLLFYGMTWLTITLGQQEASRRTIAYFQQHQPDVIISVLPMLNGKLHHCVTAYTARQPMPFMVLITDLQESMKYSWFPRNVDYYAICGTKRAYRQALRKPHPSELTFRTSGLIVHPKFYDLPPLDRAKERQKLELLPDLPTGCMMYGGFGSMRMTDLAKTLQDGEPRCQMIFLCGRNEAVAHELAALKLNYPHVIRTYTPDVPYYFAISDFLVSKPGPGTISEALVMNLRLVVDCQHVLPQERYNVKWVQQQQIGASFKSLRSFEQAIRQVIDTVRGTPASQNPGKPRNRAIFEIPNILEHILSSE